MELTDIMPVEGWKAIAENINRNFGMNGTVYHKDNSVLAKSDGWANKVCPAIKSGDSVVVCASAQQRLSRIVQANKDFATGECDAGCIKFLIPVFFKGDFVFPQKISRGISNFPFAVYSPFDELSPLPKFFFMKSARSEASKVIFNPFLSFTRSACNAEAL